MRHIKEKLKSAPLHHHLHGPSGSQTAFAYFIPSQSECTSPLLSFVPLFAETFLTASQDPSEHLPWTWVCSTVFLQLHESSYQLGWLSFWSRCGLLQALLLPSPLLSIHHLEHHSQHTATENSLPPNLFQTFAYYRQRFLPIARQNTHRR